MVIKENVENLIKVRDTAQTYAHLHKILFNFRNFRECWGPILRMKVKNVYPNPIPLLGTKAQRGAGPNSSEAGVD